MKTANLAYDHALAMDLAIFALARDLAGQPRQTARISRPPIKM